jgi:hypothetical protein
MNPLRTTALAGLLVLAATSTVLATSFPDPSFEKPVITPGTFQNFTVGQNLYNNKWNVVGPAGAQVSIISCPYVENGINFFAPNGRNFVDLTGDGSNQAEGISQAIPTNANVAYTVKFRVGNVTGASTVNVLVNGTPVFSATNSTNSGTTVNWQLFTFTFVASGPSTAVAFMNGDPPTDDFNGLDHIVISP